MSRKRFTPEQIITKLREAEVELAKGQRAVEVCRKIGVAEQTYYRWRREYGGLRVDQARRLKELEKENARLKRVVADQALDNAILKQRHRGSAPTDEPRLVTRMIEFAMTYGRYGYRRVTALLRREGWRVNHKRVERLWRREGLKVPQKQPKRGRLWLNDGSCLRLRPEHRNHVWSYDFVADRTHDGRPLRMLTIVDEYTRECLTIDVARRLGSNDVLERLADLMVERGTVGVKTLFIEPGSPWENGYVESFNGKFRDELLNGELFYTLTEAKVLIERWRNDYNRIRPHSALGYRPPAPEAIRPLPQGSATLRPAAMALGLT